VERDTVTKSPAQLDAEIAEAIATPKQEHAAEIVIPSPPPSIRTDRQRRNWYWRKFQAAQKYAGVVASEHSINSLAYRNADAIRDALQREWEWYSALLQEDE
jgi:hypothetical protein